MLFITFFNEFMLELVYIIVLAILVWPNNLLTMGKETLSGCFGKERRVSQRRGFAWDYGLLCILNCINQITEEGRIVVSYCLNPEKNVASVLIAGTGNISVAGAVSAGTNDDVTWLVCKMIAERMNAHLWKDEEFKDGLRFIFELPQ